MLAFEIWQPVIDPKGWAGRVIEIKIDSADPEPRYSVFYDAPHPSPRYPDRFPRWAIYRDVFTAAELTAAH
jgi:hypothetical protein